MRKYTESKTTRIMMASVPQVTSGLGLRKFQADGFLLTRVYISHLDGNMEKFSRADTKTLTLHNIATLSFASLF